MNIYGLHSYTGWVVCEIADEINHHIRTHELNNIVPTFIVKVHFLSVYLHITWLVYQQHLNLCDACHYAYIYRMKMGIIVRNKSSWWNKIPICPGFRGNSTRNATSVCQCILAADKSSLVLLWDSRWSAPIQTNMMVSKAINLQHRRHGFSFFLSSLAKLKWAEDA